MTISTTTNLGLKKPVLGTAEDADITTINDNMDTLDAAVGAVDVETDGSLQEQVTALGESVYYDVLFNGDSKETITLSASAADYSHMRIYFRNGDSCYSSIDVYSPNNKRVCLFAPLNMNSAYGPGLKSRDIWISGTSITTTATNRYSTTGISVSENKIVSSTANNDVFITRVEAWK